MPELARFLLKHALVGFGIAVPFVAMLIACDAGGLGTLVRGSSAGLAAALLLTAFVGLTFGSLQMGIAVWQAGKEGLAPPPRDPLAEEDDHPLRR